MTGREIGSNQGARRWRTLLGAVVTGGREWLRSTLAGTATMYTSAAYLFGVAFVVLRLLGEIDWPWLWVTAPLSGVASCVTHCGHCNRYCDRTERRNSMAEKQEAVVDKFIARMDEWAKWLESDTPTTVERDQIVAACERAASAGMSKQENPAK